MAPPPALAFASPAIASPAIAPAAVASTVPAAVAPEKRVSPVERAVNDILAALERSSGDRVVLQSNEIPLLLVGSRKCALMVGRLSAKAVVHIASYLFTGEHLEALEEIGGACYRWPGFVALAVYDGADLTVEIKRAPR